MQFFASAITTLQTLVIALGAGLGIWGVINLLEGYGSDNPGAMLIYGKEATTQIENSVPYYSVSSGAVTRKCCCSIFMPLK